MNRIESRRRTAIPLAALLLLSSAAATAEIQVLHELAPAAPLAVPPLPPTDIYPVQLVLDDDTAEGSVGASSGQAAKQFFWFNSFYSSSLFHLHEVWVLFPIDAVLVPGAPIQIVVMEDADGDPTNGATLVEAFDSTAGVADGNTFSIYPLPETLTFSAGGYVYIGVVPRYIVSGVTPFSLPAAIDSTTDQGGSWIAIWNADPPDPPTLPADAITAPASTFTPGNWMIRGFGTDATVLEIPALDGAGLAAFALLLAAAATWQARRRVHAREVRR